jgi:hypothetical protein
MAKRPGYQSANRYREFLAASKKIAGKIAKIEGVVGILATGGVGRGHCDDFSDLDLIVYADQAVVKDLNRYIAVGGLRFKGMELDTPVVSYQKALKHKSPSKYWSQVRRWDRENSKILFDTDRRVERLLKAKLVFPDWEQKKLLKTHAQGVTDDLIYNFELWLKRGTPLNLSHILIQGTEHLILWIYAKNKRFQPFLPKWLFYYLENGFVPESKYLSTVKLPFVAPATSLRDVRKLRTRLVDLAEKLGVDFEFKTIAEVHDEEEANWEKASDRTKYYLSW